MSNYCELAAVVRTDYETPAFIFNPLDAEFHFTLDVCAQEHNRKLEHYYSPEADGLLQPWDGEICWMNPPYGREISKWVEKAHHVAQTGLATVVCLLPARTNNEWWKYCIEGEVRFIRKKIQFVNSPHVTMFPNVIVIFRPYLFGGGKMLIWRPF